MDSAAPIIVPNPMRLPSVAKPISPTTNPTTIRVRLSFTLILFLYP